MGPLILVVDDNPDILFYIKITLENQDFQLVTAQSGEEAIEKLKKLDTLPDLILSDINMPKMDGYDLFKEVSNTLAWSHIPFIFLSALSSPEDVRFGKLLGVDDYITKPFKEEDLLAVIQGKIARNKKNSEFDKKVNEILKLQIELKPNQEEVKDMVLILVIWDDVYGPRLVSSSSNTQQLPYPLEKIGVQLYNSANSMYGDDDFTKAGGILLNIANFNQDAYIFFDAKTDENYRSGEKQYMLGVLAQKLSYLESLQIKNKFIEISNNMKQNDEWQLEKYADSISEIFSNGK